MGIVCWWTGMWIFLCFKCGEEAVNYVYFWGGHFEKIIQNLSNWCIRAVLLVFVAFLPALKRIFLDDSYIALYLCLSILRFFRYSFYFSVVRAFWWRHTTVLLVVCVYIWQFSTIFRYFQPFAYWNSETVETEVVRLDFQDLNLIPRGSNFISTNMSNLTILIVEGRRILERDSMFISVTISRTTRKDCDFLLLYEGFHMQSFRLCLNGNLQAFYSYSFFILTTIAAASAASFEEELAWGRL